MKEVVLLRSIRHNALLYHVQISYFYHIISIISLPFSLSLLSLLLHTHMIDPKTLTYNIALWLFNVLADLFFREIRARNAYRIPTQGPVIFVVGPHANQVSKKEQLAQ
jgi:hypothetical protein